MRTQVETIIDVQLTNRNRVTAFFRWILIFPVIIFASTFTQMAHWGISMGGIIVLPVVLSLLFRGIYPSYAFSFNIAMLELNARIAAYALLLTDDFPSIESNPKVVVLVPDVDGGKSLHKALPLIKWFLAIPLYLVGFLYTLATAVVTIVAWIIVSATGSYPQWAVEIVLGTVSYWNRVIGYSAVLVTDQYPKFSL
jgi:hypothetical protein